MEQLNKQKKEINIGISLLRIWMCFEVVLEHFKIWNWDTINQNSELHQSICNFLSFYMFMAVPCFMILAFMFTDIEQIAREGDSFKRRLIRLITPVIFWGVLYLIVYLLLDHIYGTKNIQFKTDFFWQIAFGHAYNRTLWFQFDLIVITLLYACIYRFLDKKKALIVIAFLALFALMAQYSGTNAITLQKINLVVYPKTYVLEPLGRLCEMIPYATIGIAIKEFKVFERKDSAIDTLLKIAFSIVTIKLFRSNSIFYTPLGFVYQGIQKIVIAFFCVVCFYLFHQIFTIFKLNTCKVWGGGKLYSKICNGNLFFSKTYSFNIIYDWSE